jgi:hypothetical protein
MATIVVGQQNSQPPARTRPGIEGSVQIIELFVEDNCEGRPVVLLHGWPLDSRSCKPQFHPLLAAGYRWFLIPPGVPHNPLDLGPGTGQMLSTYIVDPDEPLACFTH